METSSFVRLRCVGDFPNPTLPGDDFFFLLELDLDAWSDVVGDDVFSRVFRGENEKARRR